jgi:hypothetical protein
MDGTGHEQVYANGLPIALILLEKVLKSCRTSSSNAEMYQCPLPTSAYICYKIALEAILETIRQSTSTHLTKAKSVNRRKPECSSSAVVGHDLS